ncbi:oxidative stress defense protein [Rickettsiella endosymbiont of Dermanyssus gallinae]|uniref:oxidative stress defense protein n=1 Tax=Rickettsiella endosymbiont of Dermanyssus gallinae TaxID=2856608 RepID=UPI001C533E92|nr:oxidative stress defense protein [Rickettsiella endosymbiont of Dermanyssus gallinae]
MKLKTLTLATLLGLGMPLALLPPKAMAKMPTVAHIITSGTASVDAVPDMATINIEVSVLAKDAAEAKKQVDTRVTQYFDFLRQNGIEKKDINAANLSTQAEYDYPKTGETLLKGYRATRQIQVTVRQIDKLNMLLDSALTLGLNEIRDIKLGVSNPSSYREQARKKAIANAIAQADSLAAGFNVKRGPVYSIRYHIGGYPSMPTNLYKSVAATSASNTAKTYEQETIHFEDQVDVIFELQNNSNHLKSSAMHHLTSWRSACLNHDN